MLVVDGAGGHAGREFLVPEGSHPCFLRRCSQELRPENQLWPVVSEELANRSFAGFDEMKEVALRRCEKLRETPGMIHDATMFHRRREIDAAA